MSRKYKFYNKAGLYFVSFATVNWIEVFTRQIYFDIIVDSINYCRAEKGMELYFLLMLINANTHIVLCQIIST